jgi:hypothetical protein
VFGLIKGGKINIILTKRRKHETRVEFHLFLAGTGIIRQVIFTAEKEYRFFDEV